jgi:HAD superfamily hydrolase (TIGR01490 family)
VIGVATDTLALFDLDHTLIPFDSGLAWTRFLVGRGVLSAQAEAQYLDFCHQYVAGTLDIHAMHRANLQPLLRYPRATLAQWQQEFEDEMTPRVPASARDLVLRHQQSGHLCAVVTATTRLIAEPFARLFGIEQLVSTQAATVDGSSDAPFTGEIDGEPCYRQHKVTRVNRWLASQPAGTTTRLTGFARSWFYSDSIGDLPLLSAVSHPVAVCPDDRLRAHALAAGWPVIVLA